jgi:hypothetical protein
MTKRSANRIQFLAVAVALTVATVAANSARADILPVGSEFQVNTYTTNGQYGASARGVSRSADGRFVVVWESSGQDGSGASVHGQRYDSTGAPDGTEFQVNTYTTNGQREPAVSSAPDGRFVVVWKSSGQDGSSTSIEGQRYDAAGAPDGTEFQVNTYTTSDQFRAAVWSAADGRFVVVWTSNGADGSSFSVQARRYDSTGAPEGTEFQVNSFTTDIQINPSVSGAADGSFVVVWSSNGPDGDYLSIEGQRFDAAGAPDGTEFQVNTYTTSAQDYPAVSSTPDGRFVVVWDSNGADGDGTAVRGQRYDETGATDGTEFQVNGYTTSYQYRAAVATDADGSFVVVWSSYGQDAPYSFSVQGRRFDATGMPDGTEFQVNTYTTGKQYYSESIASDGNGDFVVVWDSVGQDGDSDGTFGQLYCADANGNAICDSAEAAACSASPQPGCVAAQKAKLDYDERHAGKEKVKLAWKKLVDATVQGDFGAPVAGSTSVALCIYDDTDALVQALAVDRAGDQCAGKDCWKAKGTKGYAYQDKEKASDGIAKIGYKSGDAGKGQAKAVGKDKSDKGQTALPTGVVAMLTGNTAPTIQLVTSDGFCTTATMNTIKKDDGARYSAQLK